MKGFTKSVNICEIMCKNRVSALLSFIILLNFVIDTSLQFLLNVFFGSKVGLYPIGSMIIMIYDSHVAFANYMKTMH